MYPEIYKKLDHQTLVVKPFVNTFDNCNSLNNNNTNGWYYEKIALQMSRIKYCTYNVNLRPKMHIFSTTSLSKISFHDTE